MAALSWKANFNGTEYRIFRGKVIAGLLKTSNWKNSGHGELDGYMFHNEHGCLGLFSPALWPARAALLPLYGTKGAAMANVVASLAGFAMMGLASRRATAAS